MLFYSFKSCRKGRKAMIINEKYWQKLFLICLGVFVGTAFCMKWMESSFYSNGSLFTIIGLEISYSKEQMVRVLSGLSDHVRSILRYHLIFDFVFMLGAYPGIAALCMMARNRTHKHLLRKVFLTLAFAQLIAFACDIAENSYLLGWISEPASIKDLGPFHTIVIIKWTLALLAVLVAIPLLLLRRK